MSEPLPLPASISTAKCCDQGGTSTSRLSSAWKSPQPLAVKETASPIGAGILARTEAALPCPRRPSERHAGPCRQTCEARRPVDHPPLTIPSLRAAAARRAGKCSGQGKAVAPSFPAAAPSSISSRPDGQAIPLALLGLDGSMRPTASMPGTVACNSAIVPTQAAAINQTASKADSDWDIAFLPTEVRKWLAWHDSEIRYAQ